MKHAYLIIAHEDFEMLKILINMIDDERNDIFIHVDFKAKYNGNIIKCIKSQVYILDKHIDARWADFSLVEVELLLFKTASQKATYSYYHLLSGVDIPVKSQDFIHKVCIENFGKEFISYTQNVPEKMMNYRHQHYFLFPRTMRNAGIVKKIIRKSFIILQDIIHYKRTDLELKKGSQWCSLTHNFVEYILNNEELIRNTFHHSFCPDETFIQTLCWNSPFKNNLYKYSNDGNKRFIRWKNNQLVSLNKEDLKLLENSDFWFTRKINSSQRELITLIGEMINKS